MIRYNNIEDVRGGRNNTSDTNISYSETTTYVHNV